MHTATAEEFRRYRLWLNPVLCRNCDTSRSAVRNRRNCTNFTDDLTRERKNVEITSSTPRACCWPAAADNFGRDHLYAFAEMGLWEPARRSIDPIPGVWPRDIRHPIRASAIVVSDAASRPPTKPMFRCVKGIL